MSREIKYQFRITKYNPAFRNCEGHYTKTDEWTSAYDIGKWLEIACFSSLYDNINVI
ncbi:hypothetical protein [Cytobacillus sp. IB215316]|uniref:hypothetical protein n=1 Tax=Cytobacillus sp. IB215316 TaxID=3097354 RepID=UPI002A1259E1|nr:hypothetical protein [Cytobacillus sp. IB215316]MDX8362433.1 hypothetical protein [Cytobacillus sp. IB215316]